MSTPFKNIATLEYYFCVPNLLSLGANVLICACSVYSTRAFQYHSAHAQNGVVMRDPVQYEGGSEVSNYKYSPSLLCLSHIRCRVKESSAR